MTVDEELNLLDEAVRRLKVEYDVFFGGGSKKPPTDAEWRVQSLVKKYSDSQKLTFGQRFKYNTIVQRYAIYSDLWRQKMKIKEEGYRRPQDAQLGISGMRTAEEHSAAEALASAPQAAPEPFYLICSDPDTERDGIRTLYQAILDAKQQTGESVSGTFDSFYAFVKRKTSQLRRDLGCQAVEYSVEMQGGQVKLKAKAKA